ncbi:unnamed protein product [Pylaiella littoralis]
MVAFKRQKVETPDFCFSQVGFGHTRTYVGGAIGFAWRYFDRMYVGGAVGFTRSYLIVSDVLVVHRGMRPLLLLLGGHSALFSLLSCCDTPSGFVWHSRKLVRYGRCWHPPPSFFVE